MQSRIRFVLSGLSVVMFSSAALASFDLMLIGGSDGRIHRYDPINQVNLGSFVSGSANELVTGDGSGNVLYSSFGNSGVRQVRYSSGELVQIVDGSASHITMEAHNGSIFDLTLSTVRRREYLTGSSATSVTLAAGITWLTSAISGNSLTAIGVNANNVVVYQSVDTNTMTVGGLGTTGLSVQAGSKMGKAAAAFNAGTGSRQLMFTFMSSTGGINIGRMNLGSNGAPSSNGVSASAVNGYSASSYMPVVTQAHTGWFIYGQDSTTATLARITRYELFTSALFVNAHTINMPGGSVPAGASFAYQVHNVVAPEPGTMLALGAGVAVLLRRRKAKN